jgi:hypothetical protein
LRSDTKHKESSSVEALMGGKQISTGTRANPTH